MKINQLKANLILLGFKPSKMRAHYKSFNKKDLIIFIYNYTESNDQTCFSFSIHRKLKCLHHNLFSAKQALHLINIELCNEN